MGVLRNIIREQINAFFETFGMDNDKKTYVPPTNVSKVASTALSVLNKIQQSGGGVSSINGEENQGSGKIKANSLSQKTPQKFSEMNRLKAFFTSNLKNVEEERSKHGIIQQRKGTEHEMMKSNTILVWNLHGGDECKKWVETQLSDTHKQGNKKKERLRKAGGAHQNNGMGVFKTQYDPSQQRILR